MFTDIEEAIAREKNAERMETGQERNSCQESEPSFKRLGGRFRMDIILFTLTRHSDDYRKEESHIYLIKL